ncbi:hypothetical protein [Acidovorax sp. sic0104]|uniref:hypothetical protein n=1 Tax=Acidovorax sp. sic0104 TaxID=2854784 RepID=UPI001C44A140|nr:hypothetical protein [Acidovorax sp. sic0104]MBV7543562.1 hypothetical protein [Acidovorax sp. sic0104]
MATPRSNGTRSNSGNSTKPRKKSSSWRSVRMPQQGSVARTLQQRYSLRLHGLLIGSFTLLLMWCTSHVQMLVGVDSLALRYAVTLSVGYLAYLLVLRAWAARLVDRREHNDGGDAGLDLPDVSWPNGGGSSSGGGGGVPLPRTGGGNFGGGGASGDYGGGWTSGLSNAGSASSSGSEGSALGDLASGAADAIGSADEGAVVVVPVVAIFLIGAALIFGAGSLAMLFFGWDVLLTVAVELAFSVATARVAVGVEREGWLGAAVRLTWKPLLGALLCAVALGATIDHFLPDVQSLPQAVRAIQGR